MDDAQVCAPSGWGTPSRRAVVFGAIAIAVAGVGVGRESLAARASAPASLHRAAFTTTLGESFTLESVPGRPLIELVKLRSLRGAAAAHSESFSLLFKTNPELSLTQDVYTLDHRATGTFDALLVPMHVSAEGCFHEVVFNRWTP